MDHHQDNNPPPPLLTMAARSDIGRSRTANQDYAYAGTVPGAPEWTLLAVADGLGGHARGEWASQRTIELLAGSLGALLASQEPLDALSEAIRTTNTAVNIESRAIGARGAATTLVLALVRGREAWWANVGDSRLYRHHAGALRQVSNDHSWVAEQVRAGRLPSAALTEHPEKNVVTRTIGFEPAVAPEIAGPLLLRDGETLLLCSDGLHGPLANDVVSRSIAELEPEHAAERLVELANEAGGPDNVTVVMARLDAPAIPAARTELTEQPAAAATARPKRRRRRLILWSGATALLAGAASAVPLALAFL